MTGPELRAAREALGWSRLHLAEILGVHHSSLARMETAAWEVVPPTVAKPLEARARAAERNPIPKLRGGQASGDVAVSRSGC